MVTPVGLFNGGPHRSIWGSLRLAPALDRLQVLLQEDGDGSSWMKTLSGSGELIISHHIPAFCIHRQASSHSLRIRSSFANSRNTAATISLRSPCNVSTHTYRIDPAIHGPAWSGQCACDHRTVSSNGS